MREERALSQSEIEALLTQLPGQQEEISEDSDAPARMGGRHFSRVVKTYDFRRPDKFSKEQWTTLQSIHEQFARITSASFSSRLRTLVEVHLTSLDQGLYEEWQRDIPNQTVCYVLSMQPLPGNIVVEFGMEVAAGVIDRLLGGTGTRLPNSHEFGEIELGLLRAFSRSITQSLQEVWSQIQPLEPQVQDIGLEASLVQVAAPMDVVVSVSFEVSVGGQAGRMSFCLPYTVLEPIVSKLSTQVWMSSGKYTALTDAERQSRAAVIQRSRLDLVAQLGAVDVPARVLAELQEGDTFVLDHRSGQTLDLLVGGRVRFTGVPGTSGSHLAVQIAAVEHDDMIGRTTPTTVLLPAPADDAAVA